MSCHNVGRALNSVVRTTMDLLDNGEISKDAAKTIIKCCRKSIGWCDGNDYEAIAYIRRCVCGRCMKLVPEGEKLYSVYGVSNSVPHKYDLDNDLAVDSLCQECFDIVLNKHCGDENAGPRERKYIEERYAAEEYTSTGKYEDHNNGYRWED